MITYTIITITSIFAALMCGFYFGYIKREGKPPESMPIVTDVLNAMEKAVTKEKKEKPSSEELKANSFFN